MSLATAFLPDYARYARREEARERHVIHPIQRLYERYAVYITRRQYAVLNKLLNDQAARWDTRILRFVQRSCKRDRFDLITSDSRTMWLVNLKVVLGGRDRWVLAVFCDTKRNIRTFLPDPCTSNPRRVVNLLGDHHGRLGGVKKGDDWL